MAVGQERRRAATPWGDRPSVLQTYALLVVRTVVVVLQRNGLAGAGAERRVVDVVVADGRVHRGLGLLGRLDPDVAVAGQTRTGRDELTDDDVLLEADERVGLGVDRRVREDSRRLLEGRRRQPGLRGQRGLGDPHELRTTGGRVTALLDHTTVLGLELRALDQLTGQQLGVAGLDDRHAAEHLPDDDLDVLVVDRHTLRVVHLLDLADQVDLDGTLAQDAQHVVRVGGTHGELLAHLDVLALADQESGALRDRVRRLVAAVVRGDDDLLGLLGLLDPDAAGGLGDRGDALRGTGLEELDDTRQTLGDVV